MKQLVRRLSTTLLVTITIVAVLVLWEVLVRLLDIPMYLVPPPSAVFKETLRLGPELLRHTWVTFYEIVIGFLISVVLGVPIGILIVYSPWLEQVSYVLLVISQAVPKVALAPLFLVWLGFGMQTIVLLTFLISFFPIVVNTVVGMRSIAPEMLLLAKAMKATQLQTFAIFRLPVALPSIFGGLKVASTLAVVGAIVAEFVGSQEGLGYLILSANANFQTPLAFAAIAILSLMGLAIFYFIAFLENRVVFWQRSNELEPEAWQRASVGVDL
jgi:NitT/TauT family transport system permease protein